ncbi:hypothetical protein [Streptomyces sp. NPDC048568]|uniref:hypothetical protein n=1 Tax=Streptomyces sp. NPDC048568 TaxID=3365571 RepID=UPI00371916C6
MADLIAAGSAPDRYAAARFEVTKALNRSYDAVDYGSPACRRQSAAALSVAAPAPPSGTPAR